MAHRVISLRRSGTSEVGGEADMPPTLLNASRNETDTADLILGAICLP